MEYQLFEHLFPNLDASAGALSPLMDTLADMLYDSLRPAFIHLQDLSALCQLVDILQREVGPISGCYDVRFGSVNLTSMEQGEHQYVSATISQNAGKKVRETWTSVFALLIIISQSAGL